MELTNQAWKLAEIIQIVNNYFRKEKIHTSFLAATNGVGVTGGGVHAYMQAVNRVTLQPM